MNIGSILNGRRNELADLTWREYHAFPAMNGSVLIHGRKSMLQLKYAWDRDHKDTDAMQFGRLLHCLLFEPRELERRYRVWEGRRAGNAYDTFLENTFTDDAEVVRAEGQYSLASATDAAQAFLRNDRIQSLIRTGKAEQTVLCVEDGIQCKGRIDWVSSSEHSLVDLKTTAEIEPELFGRTFYRFGYDVKLGLYRRWLESATDSRWPVEVIVLESRPPYDVALMPIPDAVLDRGVEKALAILKQVKQAVEMDCWPGVACGGTLPLNVPRWEIVEATEEWSE